jgi:hypothetical protein
MLTFNNFFIDSSSASCCSHENVVLKLPLLNSAIRERHLAVAVLNTSSPLSLIYGAVRPEHLAEAVSFIVLITAFVHVSTLP